MQHDRRQDVSRIVVCQAGASRGWKRSIGRCDFIEPRVLSCSPSRALYSLVLPAAWIIVIRLLNRLYVESIDPCCIFCIVQTVTFFVYNCLSFPLVYSRAIPLVSFTKKDVTMPKMHIAIANTAIGTHEPTTP